MAKAGSMLVACFLGLACLSPASESAAQALPDTVGPEVIRRALLGPGTWLMNWPDTSLGFITSNAILSFEVSGQALMVRINNLAANVSCERPVTVTVNSITFAGCREPGIVLRFTPDDPVFAFRGANALRWYTLRPHP
jgi:hypothetical protein